MATATTRKVSESDYASLSESAKENGRSISEELRLLIAEHARRRRGARLVEELRTFRKDNPITLPPGMDSVALIREERDSW